MLGPETDSDLDPAPQKPLVLCVDDDPRVLTAIRRTLQREAFELITVPHPAGALEWLEAHPVTLVIADEHMPRMSGTELLRVVRSRFPNTLKVILTAFPGQRVRTRSEAVGVDALLFKPWDDVGLRHTLRRLLARGGSGGDPR